MRQVLAGLAILLVATGAHAQGVTGFFRSITGALQGGQQAPQPQQGATPVMGVRGMDQGEAVAGGAAADEDSLLMEGWTSTKGEAEKLAKKKGLASRPAALGKAEPRPAQEN